MSITKYYQRLKQWYKREVELGPTEQEERTYREPERLTDEQKEQIQSEYYYMRMNVQERHKREMAMLERYWEDKTNEDVN